MQSMTDVSPEEIYDPAAYTTFPESKIIRTGWCPQTMIVTALSLIAIGTMIYVKYFKKENKTDIDAETGEVVKDPLKEVDVWETAISSAISIGLFYALCYFGWNKTAWFLLLLPLILVIFIFGAAFGLIAFSKV